MGGGCAPVAPQPLFIQSLSGRGPPVASVVTAPAPGGRSAGVPCDHRDVRAGRRASDGLHRRQQRLAWPELASKKENARTLLRQFETLARQQPLLVIFEDLHWIDPTSRELIDHIIDRVQRLPVLLLFTYRQRPRR